MVAVNPVEAGSEKHQELSQLCPAATQFVVVAAVKDSDFPTVCIGLNREFGVTHIYLVEGALTMAQKILLIKLLLNFLGVLIGGIYAHGKLYLASQVEGFKTFRPEGYQRPSGVLRELAARLQTQNSYQSAYVQVRSSNFRAR
jgi:hypothetical protein